MKLNVKFEKPTMTTVTHLIIAIFYILGTTTLIYSFQLNPLHGDTISYLIALLFYAGAIELQYAHTTTKEPIIDV